MNVKFICVDFQKEFSDEKGQWVNHGASVQFIKNILIKDFRDRKIKVNEIISDYRQPRPGDSGNGCIPGTSGYESDIPNDIKNPNQWIKCMNSPIWIRDNIGNPNLNPGIPYQDSIKFGEWLEKYIGKYYEVDLVILFGLTMDCCVMCTAQELTWRGYNVKILFEATDPMNNVKNYKEQLSSNSPILNWADIIYYDELLTLIDKRKDEQIIIPLKYTLNKKHECVKISVGTLDVL